MYLLRRFTDLPLRRLYRYLLRKSIGVYLCGELDVDQLDVQISEGEVNITHLQVTPLCFIGDYFLINFHFKFYNRINTSNHFRRSSVHAVRSALCFSYRTLAAEVAQPRFLPLFNINVSNTLHCYSGLCCCR